jgi:hypothetical protein
MFRKHHNEASRTDVAHIDCLLSKQTMGNGALTLLRHVGSARVEDAHGAAQFAAGQRRRAGDRNAPEDLATKGSAGAWALYHHLGKHVTQQNSVKQLKVQMVMEIANSLIIAVQI